MTFIVEKTSNNTATLTITSATSTYWKFAPWVGHESTVTLIRSDGSKSYAHIDQDSLFFRYKTGNFTKGRSYVFNLTFENDQNTAEWNDVTVEIATYLRTENIQLVFDLNE